MSNAFENPEAWGIGPDDHEVAKESLPLDPRGQDDAKSPASGLNSAQGPEGWDFSEAPRVGKKPPAPKPSSPLRQGKEQAVSPTPTKPAKVVHRPEPAVHEPLQPNVVAKATPWAAIVSGVGALVVVGVAAWHVGMKPAPEPIPPTPAVVPSVPEAAPPKDPVPQEPSTPALEAPAAPMPEPEPMSAPMPEPAHRLDPVGQETMTVPEPPTIPSTPSGDVSKLPPLPGGITATGKGESKAVKTEPKPRVKKPVVESESQDAGPLPRYESKEPDGWDAAQRRMDEFLRNQNKR